MAFMADPPRWHPGKHGMYLECPYNKDLIEEMQSVVPSSERRWDMERKQWWVSDTYLDEVDNLLFIHFECVASGRD